MVAVVVVAMVMAPRGLTRYLYEGLMFSVAGLVAEVKLAGYPAAYVEEDVAGRTSVAWDAVRVARIEAGLPVCGHKDSNWMHSRTLAYGRAANGCTRMC